MNEKQTPKVNYRLELEKELEKIYGGHVEESPSSGDVILRKQESGQTPALLLHSCCAPCSSYCLEYLAPLFHITVLYYNPNIDEEPEYRKRAAEEKRLIDAYNAEGKGYPITYIDGRYDPQEFYAIARGYEKAPEGGERCFRCYELRLREAARVAKEIGADYFCTTLTISPMKDAQKLNEIGFALAQESGVRWLPSDFKKKNGYKRSIELSKEYDLYRQNYCGCSYSKASSSCANCANQCADTAPEF